MPAAFLPPRHSIRKIRFRLLTNPFFLSVIMMSMQHLQALVRPTLMNIYRITAEESDLYFRDLWFVVHSLSTLIVTGDCPYSDQE